MCRTCHHNPHIWPAFGKETDPFDMSTDTTDTGVKNAAGGARNSFLSRAASPRPDLFPPMKNLCTGCHSKGAVAEDKIPPVATHPKEKSINNIFTSNNQTAVCMKIFDDHWKKEIHVGYLSFSSCHFFYKWDHRISKSRIIKEAKEM
jgi:hypothetical protein